ncbi:Methylmalonyl-CoA epimerase [Minicystis rosea]|nr:Methylmalonyl-CoA epimerase [Minicystis rosea]
MRAMKFDHITAIVPDADAAAEALKRLFGAEPVATLALPGMAIRSFRVGEAEIHVNAPTGPGPVDDHMRRHGPGYHHLALRVDDLDGTMAELGTRGFAMLGTPVETAPGLREVFVDPRTSGGMLIQLVERRVAYDEPYALDGAAVAALAEST